MRKLFLVEAKARVLLSLVLVVPLLVIIVIIDSIDPYGRWQEESKSYQEWIKSDRSQPCKQAYDEQRAQCYSEAIAKHSLDDEIDVHLDSYICIYYSQEYRLEKSRLGCPSQIPHDPGSLAEFTENIIIKYILVKTLVGYFAMGVGVFILLTTGRLFLTETHVGWRRISLIIGALGSVGAPFYQREILDYYGESLLPGVFLALLAFPLFVLLVLGGRRIYDWVYVGFRQEQQATESVQSTAAVVVPSIIDSSVPTDPIVAQTPDQDLNAPPPEEKKLSRNYLVRHWRGELSLPVSYWINGVVLVGIVTVALYATVNGMGNGDYSLRAISFSSIGILLFSVTAWLWSVVGVWRSADHHVARGGASGWASTARIMVVLGFISMMGDLSTTILPQAKELALIAIGKDPFGEIVIKVSANGQSVIVIGALREGSAAEVQKILDAAPGATTLILNSNGGRLFEAQQLARAVRNRNLNTYVEHQCVSACTYVFLAGKDRTATPNARIGFHQPSFPGLDADTQRSMTLNMMNVYRAAGLPDAFIQRIGKTSPEDMWYPTREELIDSSVITRMSLGGETAISD